ncbi:MAG: hypothetical protein EXS09_08200 [Gemmataceae bacterium]|nr:hypothetical protein [Gemmataceae bacterium]
MLRKAFFAMSALVLGLSAANADELKGTIKNINKAGNSLTLSVDGKDKVLAVNKDASFVSVAVVAGKKKKKNADQVTPIEEGLGGLKVGSVATVLTESKDGKDAITSVKVGGGADQPAAPAKKKKKKAVASPNKAKKTAQTSTAKGTKKTDKVKKAKGTKKDKNKAKKDKKAKKKAKKSK